MNISAVTCDTCDKPVLTVLNTDIEYSNSNPSKFRSIANDLTGGTIIQIANGSITTRTNLAPDRAFN